jgi:hypothetical protein
LVEFVNEKCGTERGMDGLLNDRAGIIEEASKIVRELIAADDKGGLLAKLKEVKGAEVYVQVATRFIMRGVKGIEQDREGMLMTLNRRNNPLTMLDNVKRQYNVFGEFLGKEPGKVEEKENDGSL